MALASLQLIGEFFRPDFLHLSAPSPSFISESSALNFNFDCQPSFLALNPRTEIFRVFVLVPLRSQYYAPVVEDLDGYNSCCRPGNGKNQSIIFGRLSEYFFLPKDLSSIARIRAGLCR